LRGRQRLLAEKDDLVLEKRRADFFCGSVPRKIDAEDLGAERSCDAFDFQWLLLRPKRF
jgi:hypothetical protein